MAQCFFFNGKKSRAPWVKSTIIWDGNKGSKKLNYAQSYFLFLRQKIIKSQTIFEQQIIVESVKSFLKKIFKSQLLNCGVELAQVISIAFSVRYEQGFPTDKVPFADLTLIVSKQNILRIVRMYFIYFPLTDSLLESYNFKLISKSLGHINSVDQSQSSLTTLTVSQEKHLEAKKAPINDNQTQTDPFNLFNISWILYIEHSQISRSHHTISIIENQLTLIFENFSHMICDTNDEDNQHRSLTFEQVKRIIPHQFAYKSLQNIVFNQQGTSKLDKVNIGDLLFFQLLEMQ